MQGVMINKLSVFYDWEALLWLCFHSGVWLYLTLCLNQFLFSALEKIVTINMVIIFRGHHCIEQINWESSHLWRSCVELALPGCKGEGGRCKPHIHKEISCDCYHVLELPKRSSEAGLLSIHIEIWAKICKFTSTFLQVQRMCFFLVLTALCVRISVH